MPKRVEDIRPSTRRSIREVAAPEKRALVAEVRESEHRKTKASEPERSRGSDEKSKQPISIHRVHELTKLPDDLKKPSAKKRHGLLRKWPVLILGIIVILGIGGFLVSSRLSKAVFTIVPKSIDVSINNTFVAQGSTNSKGDLAYSLITVKGTASTTIPAVDGPYTSTKAQGKVTLFDYYSSKPQRLIAGTRITDDTGRIYRLTNSIVIPGASGSSTPGKFDATIVADQTGQQFNALKTEMNGNLKIAAYKDSSKYDTIYAKLVTDLVGGYEGTKKTVTPSSVASSTAILKTQLTASLIGQIKSAVPGGYIMYDNAYSINFTPPNISGSDQNKASLTMSAVAYGIIFNRKDLSSYISDHKTQVFGGFDFNAIGLDSLAFNITNTKDFNPGSKGALIFKMNGDLKFVGIIPVDELKNKLAGISLAQTQDVIKPYSAVIETGSGELQPPWAKVPTDTSRISIIVQNP